MSIYRYKYIYERLKYGPDSRLLNKEGLWDLEEQSLFFRKLMGDRDYRTILSENVCPTGIYKPFVFGTDSSQKAYYFFVTGQDISIALKAEQLGMQCEMIRFGKHTFFFDDGDMEYTGWILLFWRISI